MIQWLAAVVAILIEKLGIFGTTFWDSHRENEEITRSTGWRCCGACSDRGGQSVLSLIPRGGLQRDQCYPENLGETQKLALNNRNSSIYTDPLSVTCAHAWLARRGEYSIRRGVIRATILALSTEELYVLKRYLDTQQIYLQYPTIMPNCCNI